jgi:hypothetical protein
MVAPLEHRAQSAIQRSVIFNDQDFCHRLSDHPFFHSAVSRRHKFVISI